LCYSVEAGLPMKQR